jgi:hypothetical protein
MKYAIRIFDASADKEEYLADVFGEVLIFESAQAARAYAEENIDEGMSLQIIEVYH